MSSTVSPLLFFTLRQVPRRALSKALNKINRKIEYFKGCEGSGFCRLAKTPSTAARLGGNEYILD
jgi:hypothetical protein